MRFTGWILAGLLCASGAGFQANAADAGCISQTEMQEIAKHFNQFADLASRGEYCPDGSKESHLLAGIMFMRKTAFAASMPKSSDDLFSGNFSTDWYDYFIGRINDFAIQESCPRGVGAYVYMFGNTMYVCPMLLSDSFTALDRASVFMHEARHIDGYPHVTCSRGPRAGLNGACDDRISNGGSYAVSVETYVQIAKYSEGLHPALRAYSRSAAVVYADEAFQSPTRIEREPQFLALATNGEFHILNPNKSTMTTQLGQAPAVGRIVMRGQHMILYPENRSLPAKYVFARNEGEIRQEAGDIAIEYNSQSAQQRSEWVDVHMSAQWSAQLFRDRVKFTCDPRSTSTSEQTLGSERPVGFIYPEGYDRAASKILVAMESGNIFELGCQSKRPFYRASTVTFDLRFKRIQKAGGHVVGLTADGRLFKIENGKSTALQTSLDGRVFDLVPNESIQFLDN